MGCPPHGEGCSVVVTQSRDDGGGLGTRRGGEK